MSPVKAALSPTLKFETELFQQGIWPAAGLDEVGRGAWAGPVVAAAVILPPPATALLDSLHGVRDSKLMSAKQREHWAGIIAQTAIEAGIGVASSEQVDAIGILPATRLAMTRSLESLSRKPVHLIIDHLQLPQLEIAQTSVTHGDNLVLSIAAASVIAKVARDRMMVEVGMQYPEYAFARNKGYGTREHQAALRKYGICPLHRRSYRPIAQLSLPGIAEQS